MRLIIMKQWLEEQNKYKKIKEWIEEQKKSKGTSVFLDLFWFWIKVGFGFMLLAPFLFVVKCSNDNLYRSITHWANLEAVPDIDKCIVKKLPISDPVLGNDYDFYEIELSTNVKNKTGSIIFFSRKEYVDIFGAECKKENQVIPYKIFWKYNINDLANEKIKIIVNNKHVSYKDGENLKDYNCPIRAEIILDEEN